MHRDIEIERLEQYDSLGDAHRLRVRTGAGRETTAHVARYDRASTSVRIVALNPPRPLLQWCRDGSVDEALNGGFFTKPEFVPLGEYRHDGSVPASRAFTNPWHRRRGAIWIDGNDIAIAPRSAFPDEPPGDLLQAGPLLVRDGEVVVAARDPEGFSATCDEFDSDITVEPLPRTAIGIGDDGTLLALVVDGRSEEDDGLMLDELGALMRSLGARDALNLDGGACATLITGGVLRNTPRNEEGALDGGFPVPTAFVFERRGRALDPG